MEIGVGRAKILLKNKAKHSPFRAIIANSPSPKVFKTHQKASQKTFTPPQFCLENRAKKANKNTKNLSKTHFKKRHFNKNIILQNAKNSSKNYSKPTLFQLENRP